jgi:hypothetical protein
MTPALVGIDSTTIRPAVATGRLAAGESEGASAAAGGGVAGGSVLAAELLGGATACSL